MNEKDIKILIRLYDNFYMDKKEISRAKKLLEILGNLLKNKNKVLY